MAFFRSLAAAFAFLFCLLVSTGARAGYVDTADSPGAFRVVEAGHAAVICVDGDDFVGVARAAGDLADDIRKVSGVASQVVRSTPDAASRPILVGTIGKSKVIDQLVADRKINVGAIAGKWESYQLEVVANPLPGIDRALVIVGSDKRGTIYGIYDLSQEMGVSPWYWWADVPVRHRDAVFVRAGKYVQGPPAVKYRGIFINDEEPCLGSWSREKFGGLNSKMYCHMFELILRLKGNYLWPAMWGKAFNEDDPENPRLADEYGIVMGTSHHEPMIRAQAEWGRHKKDYGNAEWNYATNEAGLKKFWAEGLERNRAYESVVTIGMRGDGDMGMVQGGDMAANVALLERIVADQRAMIAQTINPDVTQVPQAWALYKEVADYYAHGMRVPDDVTLLWCDDNWGNVRRLPTPEERNRSGGAGIYYHFDYVGTPRCYKWINTNPLPKIWDQMNLAYRYGADRLWVVNVGDLKPMELPIEFFLTLAWNPDALPKEQIGQFTRRWAEREFGPEHAAEIADIVSKYAKYNGWRKPELVDPGTFSLVNYREAERVEAAWQEITRQAEEIYAKLPAESRDAFFQLVLHPTKASATVNEMYIAAGRNHLYARQQRASTNAMASRVRELFKQDQDLTDAYHKLAGGKWNHMMNQIHTAYTNWAVPPKDDMPELKELVIPEAASLGVAVEGSESAWPGDKGEPKLPPFDAINQQRYAIEVFNRGAQPFAFTAKADQPWITLSSASGQVDQDQRLWVSMDWTKAPVGTASGTVRVSRVGGESVTVKVEAHRSAEYTRQSIRGAWGGLTGPTAIAAEKATKNLPVAGVRWEPIPDYGRGDSGMTIFPVTAGSVLPPSASPCLEYQVFLPQAGDVHVDLITGPTLDFAPGRGIRVAVSFDDQEPQVLDAYANQRLSNNISYQPAIRDWGKWVTDNARTLKSTHKVAAPGVHTLKVWMVDPGVVLEKLITYTGELPPSYFGPPESPVPAK